MGRGGEAAKALTETTVNTGSNGAANTKQLNISLSVDLQYLSNGIPILGISREDIEGVLPLLNASSLRLSLSLVQDGIRIVVMPELNDEPVARAEIELLLPWSLDTIHGVLRTDLWPDREFSVGITDLINYAYDSYGYYDYDSYDYGYYTYGYDDYDEEYDDYENLWLGSVFELISEYSGFIQEWVRENALTMGYGEYPSDEHDAAVRYEKIELSDYIDIYRLISAVTSKLSDDSRVHSLVWEALYLVNQDITEYEVESAINDFYYENELILYMLESPTEDEYEYMKRAYPALDRAPVIIETLYSEDDKIVSVHAELDVRAIMELMTHGSYTYTSSGMTGRILMDYNQKETDDAITHPFTVAWDLSDNNRSSAADYASYMDYSTYTDYYYMVYSDYTALHLSGEFREVKKAGDYNDYALSAALTGFYNNESIGAVVLNWAQTNQIMDFINKSHNVLQIEDNHFQSLRDKYKLSGINIKIIDEHESTGAPTSLAGQHRIYGNINTQVLPTVLCDISFSDIDVPLDAAISHYFDEIVTSYDLVSRLRQEMGTKLTPSIHKIMALLPAKYQMQLLEYYNGILR